MRAEGKNFQTFRLYFEDLWRDLDRSGKDIQLDRFPLLFRNSWFHKTVNDGGTFHFLPCQIKDFQKELEDLLPCRFGIFPRDLKYAFRDHITPWSIDWSLEMVLGGTKMSSMNVISLIFRCAGKLSMMSAIFFNFVNFLSKSCTLSSNNMLSIQLFLFLYALVNVCVWLLWSSKEILVFQWQTFLIYYPLHFDVFCPNSYRRLTQR